MSEEKTHAEMTNQEVADVIAAFAMGMKKELDQSKMTASDHIDCAFIIGVIFEGAKRIRKSVTVDPSS